MNPNSLEAQLRHVADESPSSAPADEKSNAVIGPRPLLITLVCGYFFVHWLYSILTILLVVILKPTGSVPTLQDIFAQIGPVFLSISQTPISIIISALAIATIAGIIGLWYMQRWSLIIYSAGTIALFIFAIRQISGGFNNGVLFSLITAFILNITVIVLGCIYFKQMK